MKDDKEKDKEQPEPLDKPDIEPQDGEEPPPGSPGDPQGPGKGGQGGGGG